MRFIGDALEHAQYVGATKKKGRQSERVREGNVDWGIHATRYGLPEGFGSDQLHPPLQLLWILVHAG